MNYQNGWVIFPSIKCGDNNIHFFPHEADVLLMLEFICPNSEYSHLGSRTEFEKWLYNLPIGEFVSLVSNGRQYYIAQIKNSDGKNLNKL